jgi:outer membrane biosynthesis protein TonB
MTLRIVLLVTLLGLACQPAAAPDNAPPPPALAAPAPESAQAEEEPVETSAPEPELPPSPEPPPPPEPPSIEASEPKFLGDGTVPDVEKFLDKMKEATAQCLVDNADGAIEGSLRIQFLVRLSGRAEGVDILSAKGVNEAAQRCVRDAFRAKRVGTPTADPTGVTFTYTFE